ncbi:MAG: transcriptional regulator [Methylibium sp. NZG]|nr:MAG: transcriptional regulator [Methylibium sp. NZG]
MYLPSHFEESRPEVLHELVRMHPLGLLITLGPTGLQANPVPFMLDVNADADGDHGAAPAPVLRAHVARANPVWHEARSDVESLVVFQGPQAYISPSLYPTKAATGKVVPTWNYVVVQARGTLRVVDDAPWLHALVTRLTDKHEAPRATPWAVTDAPDDYVQTMLRAIVGIEITLTALAGKWKVSQNRSAVDRDGVAFGLRAQADARGDAQASAMAELVARGGVKG